MSAINKQTSLRPPRWPYLVLAREILGLDYDLSLVFCDSALARRLNRHWRRKNHAANILSFPLSASSGEIFINLETARREASRWGENYRVFVLHLFIHGLLHLKGMTHGSKMERAEQRLIRLFSSHGAKNNHRH